MKYGWKMGRTWGIIPMASIPICTTYNTLKMVHLNYNNLDDETQERLLSMSKKDIEKRFGEQLRNYAREHFVNYQTLLEEEAIRNLYNYKYIFRI